jgi:dTDP-4-dehydrorhamnose reductase
MAHSDLTVLVTGSAGILGRRLVPILADEHNVIALFHRNGPHVSRAAELDVVRCDLSDTTATARLISKIDPDVIVNCAALTDVDGCERNPELAERVNSGAVRNLLDAARSDRAYFVQISTDYVFDGRSGPYPEDSVANPINVYGRTKLEGETAVQSWQGRSLIVRTSALYDCHSTVRANLFAAAYNRLRNGDRVAAASDLYCNPIWAVNLSWALKEVIEMQTLGVINIAGSAYLSRYQFAETVARRYGLPTELVEQVSLADLGRTAPRPLKAGVDITKASGMLRTQLLPPSDVFQLSDFRPG